MTMVIQDKIDYSVLENCTNPELIVMMRGIADLVSNHPAFSLEDWPKDVPHPDEIREDCAQLAISADAVANRDFQKLDDRDRHRAKVIQSGIFLGQHITMRAARTGDPTCVTTSGYPLKAKKPITRKKVVAGQLEVQHGKESQTVLAKTGKVARAGGYELQYSKVNPPTEESFVMAGIYKTPSHMVVKGLERGTETFFRVRSHDDKGPGPWSPIVSIIVL